jgi:DNA-directed RNA polymerase III subunit RPC1
VTASVATHAIELIVMIAGAELHSLPEATCGRGRILVNLETIEKKNYTKGRGHMCPSDGFVCFRNSELLTGRLGKATLGDGNKDGLFHVCTRLIRHGALHQEVFCT